MDLIKEPRFSGVPGRSTEHNKVGLLVGKVLHFSLMCGMLSRAVPAAEALTDCPSPSQTMDTQSSAARQLQEWRCLNNRNINACLEQREGREGKKKSLNGWNFHSALAGAGERGGTSSGGAQGHFCTLRTCSVWLWTGKKRQLEESPSK